MVFPDPKLGRDTLCSISRTTGDGSETRSYSCEDTTRLSAIAFRDARGRIDSAWFYVGSGSYTRHIYGYDEQGRLIRVEDEAHGRMFVVSRTEYDANGDWTVSREYDEEGAVASSRERSRVSETMDRVDHLDGNGTLLTWEWIYLNARRRPEKTVTCSGI